MQNKKKCVEQKWDWRRYVKYVGVVRNIHRELKIMVMEFDEEMHIIHSRRTFQWTLEHKFFFYSDPFCNFLFDISCP